MKRARTGIKPLSWRNNCIGLWRDWAGYTQEQVAEILEEDGLIKTHTSVSRIEGGKQVPKIDTLEAMARLYGTDVHSMINRQPPSEPPARAAPQPPKPTTRTRR